MLGYNDNSPLARQHAFEFKFNDHSNRSALWDIFGTLAAPGQPPRMNTFYIRSKQVTIQTFRNTTAILQYMYFTYCISNNILMFYLLRDIKAASQYCNDNVTYERENTTQFAQYLYHTVLRAKMIGITRLYDVFTQLVT